jgi:hypothetical protein
MENEFIKFLYNLLENKDVETIINNTINNELKDLMIYVADDYYIHKDPKWITNLYEWKYKQTSYGGDKFYENLQIYHELHNQEMLRLYLIALQFGFRGSFTNFPQMLYLKYLNDLNIEFPKESYISFQAKTMESNKFPFIFLIVLPIIFLILYIIIEWSLFYKIVPFINKFYTNILLKDQTILNGINSVVVK